MADFGSASTSAAQSDLHAFITLANNPEGFAAKLSELRAAQKAADEARTNARTAQQELGAEKNALNARAVVVEKQAVKLAKDTDYLEKERSAHEADKRAWTAQASDRNRELNARENDLALRAGAIEEKERATANLNRQAQADRDAAAVLRGSLEDIAASLGTLKAQLVALG